MKFGDIVKKADPFKGAASFPSCSVFVHYFENVIHFSQCQKSAPTGLYFAYNCCIHWKPHNSDRCQLILLCTIVLVHPFRFSLIAKWKRLNFQWCWAIRREITKLILKKREIVATLGSSLSKRSQPNLRWLERKRHQYLDFSHSVYGPQLCWEAISNQTRS